MTQSAKKSSTRERLRDAAIRCIGRSGASNITMEDVAGEAGVTRMTLYREYRSRAELFETVVLHLFEQSGDRIRAAIEAEADFESAIVRGAMLATDIKNRDEIIQSVIYANDPFWLEELIVSRTSKHRTHIEVTFMSIYGPTLEKARVDGLLRKDISLYEIADWLRSFHLILYFRKELTDGEKEHFTRTFLLPSLRQPTTKDTQLTSRLQPRRSERWRLRARNRRD